MIPILLLLFCFRMFAHQEGEVDKSLWLHVHTLGYVYNSSQMPTCREQVEVGGWDE